MIVADYIVNFLKQKDVTDVFGVPGGVVLDFLYSLDKINGITPHLCCHEQAAAFAAIGYAQTNYKIGVAYATRGPGITNMITAIADAYYDSIPVLFITGHSSLAQKNNMRIEFDQELDITNVVKKVTKYVAKIDKIEDLSKELHIAFQMATEGRKGPVVIDIYSKLWNMECNYDVNVTDWKNNEEDCSIILKSIKSSIECAKRPVLLIGNGIKQSNTDKYLESFIKNNNIPVISSRTAQDIISGNPLYYGYIGSHGIREANFILSKSDLIISLGNRLAFPINSTSYSKLTSKIIRIDIDENEFDRQIPNSICFKVNLNNIMKELATCKFNYENSDNWVDICNILKMNLCSYDTNIATKKILETLNTIDEKSCLVADVGNNEFWLSKAYNIANKKNTVLYSSSFGSLGCALPKSIGAYYASKNSVVCFSGDQGFQFNIQDLQTIAKNQIPILIVIINNKSSGMILDREKLTNKPKFIHVTYKDGYSNPNFEKIAKCYGINYYKKPNKNYKLPAILQININEIINLTPSLKFGDSCQNLSPKITKELYEKLDNLGKD